MTDLWCIKEALETMVKKHPDELSELGEKSCRKFIKMIEELFEYAYEEGRLDGMEEVRRMLKTDHGEQ